jgi:sugar lactone lactonase YvrE
MKNGQSQRVGVHRAVLSRRDPRLIDIAVGPDLTMKKILFLWFVMTGAAFAADPVFNFTTFAGNTNAPGALDATGTAASFNEPFSFALDTAGNLYVGDYNNHTIRKVTPGAVVTTFAGLAGAPGTNDATGTNARFRNPDGIAVDTLGNVYVADVNNHTVRKITPAGAVTTLAGAPMQLGATDGTTTARFYMLTGVAVDGSGNVYVADRYNHLIRKINPAGLVTTLAGKANTPGGVDATNANARFNFPTTITIDSATNLYVGETGGHTIRKVSPSGTNWVVTTIAGTNAVSGTNDNAIGTLARFNTPRGLAFDSAGNLYVADSNNHTFRKLTMSGTNWAVTTFAGAPLQTGAANGVNSVARFNGTRAVAFDSTGNIFTSDVGNHRISRGVLVSAPSAPVFNAPLVSAGFVYVQLTNASSGTVVVEGFDDVNGWLPLLTNNSPSIQFFEPVDAFNYRYYRAYLKP